MHTNNFFLATTVLLLTLTTNTAHGKGAARSSRAGSYSRGTTYGYYPIFLIGPRYRGRGGSSGSHDGTPTGQARQDAGVVDPQTEEVVICKRRVQPDNELYHSDPTSRHTVFINSTRLCYLRKSGSHAAPENLPITSITLDVFQWRLSAQPNQFPYIEMHQYEDIEAPTVQPQSYLRLLFTKIFEIKGDQQLQAISTQSLNFTSTRTAPADYSVWGFPASYHKDQSKMLAYSIRATGDSLDVVLTFTVSEDFAESPFVDRSFVRPSGIKIDITVKQFPFVGSENESEIGLDFVLLHRKELPSYAATAPEGRHGTEYDPAKRNRIEIGSSSDEAERGHHYFSWEAHMHREKLCLSPDQGGCVKSNIAEMCLTASADCAAFGWAEGITAKLLTFTGNQIGSKAPSPKCILDFSRPMQNHIVEWSAFLGTFDQTEVPTPTSSGCGLAVNFVGGLVLCFFALLM